MISLFQRIEEIIMKKFEYFFKVVLTKYYTIHQLFITLKIFILFISK